MEDELNLSDPIIERCEANLPAQQWEIVGEGAVFQLMNSQSKLCIGIDQCPSLSIPCSQEQILLSKEIVSEEITAEVLCGNRAVNAYPTTLMVPCKDPTTQIKNPLTQLAVGGGLLLNFGCWRMGSSLFMNPYQCLDSHNTGSVKETKTIENNQNAVLQIAENNQNIFFSGGEGIPNFVMFLDEI